MEIETIKTEPKEGQKPGTSGLRKKTAVFKEGYYLHNFVQAIFDSVPQSETQGCTMLVSGDGRYHNKEAIQIVCEIAAANGVKRVWIGKDGLCSTPAASCILREREGGAAKLGIVLTASHNPGGPTNDFGIKFNLSRGEPANEALTGKVYERTKVITEFKRAKLPKIDFATIGVTDVADGFKVEVIDPTEDWMKLMCSIFDMDQLRTLMKRPDFSMVFDGMHGVSGIYARRLLVDELGAPESALANCVSKDDFGGGHPDPNLTYAPELVERMAVNDPTKVSDSTPVFGAACDGDGDRNMVLGSGVFVVPSDSLAIVAANAAECIPYFKGGVKGVSRSMPTSKALDLVASQFGIPVFETPTGWKFFCNLMDAEKISICGEESFGTSSDHIREKDGLWAVLCWLSILSKCKGGKPSVSAVLEDHWKTFGRNYYMRYDYENVSLPSAEAMMDYLRELTTIAVDSAKIGEKVPAVAEFFTKNPVASADDFCYNDSVDGSVTAKQGIRFSFRNGSRIVYRISGTSAENATIRIYFERYEKAAVDLDMREALKEIMAVGVALCDVKRFTDRDAPTVIT